MIPGIGPKTAEKILSAAPNVPTMKYLVLQEYIKHYGQREGILQFANACNLIFMMDDLKNMDERISEEQMEELMRPARQIAQPPVQF